MRFGFRRIRINIALDQYRICIGSMSPAAQSDIRHNEEVRGLDTLMSQTRIASELNQKCQPE